MAHLDPINIAESLDSMKPTIEQLSTELSWYSVFADERNTMLPNDRERVLIYLEKKHWFTMATFVDDEQGKHFICHCTTDPRPAVGQIFSVGETPIYWTRLTPSLPFASPDVN